MIIKIRLIAERELIAGILIKNGYKVKQVTIKRLSGKGNDICLSTTSTDNFLRIRNLYEMQIVAGKLVKNGYDVERIKVPRISGKSFETCLSIEEPEEMVPSAERGDLD